jgi:hypothetical protein
VRIESAFEDKRVPEMKSSSDVTPPPDRGDRKRYVSILRLLFVGWFLSSILLAYALPRAGGLIAIGTLTLVVLLAQILVAPRPDVTK